MATRAGDQARFTIEIPWEVWRAAKVYAIDVGCDLRDVVIEALREKLRHELQAQAAAPEGRRRHE